MYLHGSCCGVLMLKLLGARWHIFEVHLLPSLTQLPVAEVASPLQRNRDVPYLTLCKNAVVTFARLQRGSTPPSEEHCTALQ